MQYIGKMPFNIKLDVFIFKVFAIAMGAFLAPWATASNLMPSSIYKIGQELHRNNFDRFKSEMRQKLPELSWGDLKSPDFEVEVTRLEWRDRFIDTAINQSGFSSAQAQSFSILANEYLTSYFHNLPYARIDFIQERRPLTTALSQPKEVYRLEHLNLQRHFRKNHTLDVFKYVDERFPRVLQNFVKDERIPLYLHNTGCEKVQLFHSNQNFSRAFSFMSLRDTPDSQTMIVYNETKGTYRIAICNIRGEDDKIRIMEILGPIFYGKSAFMVRHKNSDSLIGENDRARELKINSSRDFAVIGFQNTVWSALSDSDPQHWSRISLSESGADLSVFEGPEFNIVSLSNVYGDEILQGLDYLYKKGLRRFVYLGTAGALNRKLQIGDLLLPTHFMNGNKNLTLVNSLENLFKRLEPEFSIRMDSLDRIESKSRTYLGTTQGRVSTLMLETKPFLLHLQELGIDAIDVEAVYFAKFFTSHSFLDFRVAIVVSDLPLGSMSYDQENLSRAIPMNTIKSNLGWILKP